MCAHAPTATGVGADGHAPAHLRQLIDAKASPEPRSSSHGGRAHPGARRASRMTRAWAEDRCPGLGIAAADEDASRGHGLALGRQESIEKRLGNAI